MGHVTEFSRQLREEVAIIILPVSAPTGGEGGEDGGPVRGSERSSCLPHLTQLANGWSQNPHCAADGPMAPASPSAPLPPLSPLPPQH